MLITFGSLRVKIQFEVLMTTLHSDWESFCFCHYLHGRFNVRWFYKFTIREILYLKNLKSQIWAMCCSACIIYVLKLLYLWIQISSWPRTKWEHTSTLRSFSKRSNLTFYGFYSVYDAGNTANSMPFIEPHDPCVLTKLVVLVTKPSKGMWFTVSV